MNDPSDPRTMLKELERRAKKRFGQHFLARPTVVERMLRVADVQAGDKVLEVGPGLGILTQALVRAGADVTAVEVDDDLAAHIGRTYPGVRLVHADATRVDWAEVCPGEGWKVVANLPYNVGTGLLMGWVRAPERFRQVTAMLQVEVVNRMTAVPGTKAYGALTVQLALWAEARSAIHVPAKAFVPPPKVESAVVHVEVRDAPDTDGLPPARVEKLVKLAFSQRRKTLRNALKAGWPRTSLDVAFAATGIDGGIRGERLEAAQFVALAKALAEAP